MLNKITILLKDGTHQVVILPEEADLVTVTLKGMDTCITLPSETRNGDVHVTLTTNELDKYELPHVTLCVGDWDAKGFRTRTDAMMYATDNGRIIGKNQTLGYASTEKPLATKPWVRGDK